MKAPRDFKQLCAWIKKNAPKDKRDGTIENAAYWFVAYREAAWMHDVNMVKDWAHVLLNGLPPIKDDPEAVTEFLGRALDPEESGVDGEEAEEVLIATLNTHFGIIYHTSTLKGVPHVKNIRRLRQG